MPLFGVAEREPDQFIIRLCYSNYSTFLKVAKRVSNEANDGKHIKIYTKIDMIWIIYL